MKYDPARRRNNGRGPAVPWRYHLLLHLRSFPILFFFFHVSPALLSFMLSICLYSSIITVGFSIRFHVSWLPQYSHVPRLPCSSNWTWPFNCPLAPVFCSMCALCAFHSFPTGCASFYCVPLQTEVSQDGVWWSTEYFSWSWTVEFVNNHVWWVVSGASASISTGF